MTIEPLPSEDVADRRTFLLGGGSLALVSLAPTAHATPEEMQTAIRETFGDRPITQGRVAMKLPPIAENGNSVSLRIDVDSPMSEADHVRQIAVFAEKNPLPNIARYHLGPHNGRASVAARIRLSDSQTITAIAEMNDGSLWSGEAATVITLAACVVI